MGRPSRLKSPNGTRLHRGLASLGDESDLRLIPKVTLRQLGYFVSATQHQSVVKAAAELNVSPPAVSAAISQLEGITGMRLFIRRHARGLVLTKAGREMATAAREILTGARNFEDVRQVDLHAMEGRIDFGCLLSFAPYLIPPMLQAFDSLHPKVRVRLREDNHGGLITALEDGAIELAVLYDFDMPSTVHSTPLRTMPIQAILAPGHPLCGRARVPLAALEEEPFILLDLPHTRDYILSIFAGLNLSPRIAYQAQSYEMVRGLVAGGFGYSLLNFCPPVPAVSCGSVVSRPLREPVKAPNLVIARLYRHQLNRITEAFTTHVQSYVAGMPVASKA